MAQCTAKSKQSGERCKRAASRGYTVCSIHGGKTPKGIASATFVHGRYSKDLPGRLLSRYEEAQQDPELLNLRGEIALIESRLGDLLGRVDTGEAGSLWRHLRASWQQYRRAMAAENAGGMAAAMAEIGETIARGAGDAAAWSEIAGLVQDRRKLVESERKRIVEAHQSVELSRAMLIVQIVLDVMHRRIADRALMGAIARDIEDRLEHAGVTL